MRKKNIKFTIYTFLFLLSICLLWTRLYSSGEKILISKVNVALQAAVDKELDREYYDLKIHEYFTRDPETEKIKKTFIIKSASGTEIREVGPIYGILVATEDYHNRFQHTTLINIRPLKADSILLLFNENLLRQGQKLESALNVSINRLKDTVSTCTGDSSLFVVKNRKSPVVFAGLSNEIVVKPYIRYSCFSIIRNASIDAVVIIYLLFAFVFLLLLILANRFKIKGKEILSSDICEYKLHRRVVFYPELHRLMVNGEEHILMSQQSALLSLFLESEDHKLSNEQISHALWPDGSATTDRIQKVISRLRIELQDDVLSKIVQNSGYYQLII